MSKVWVCKRRLCLYEDRCIHPNYPDHKIDSLNCEYYHGVNPDHYPRSLFEESFDDDGDPVEHAVDNVGKYAGYCTFCNVVFLIPLGNLQ